MDSILQSKKSEFLAVYGRRRVGKTFLIREHFNYTFDFQISGLANATTAQQLFNFDTALRKQSPLVFDSPSDNWLVAFQRLTEHLENKMNNSKKVIFIDELPWFDTKASDFMIGLHNRITQKMKIEPFNLKETEEMLVAKNCVLDRYQMIQLYMKMGGIPYYLEAVQPQWSAAQNIQELFFEKSGLLKNEFFNLYRSLFRKYEVYEKIVEALSTKTSGLQRADISRLSRVEIPRRKYVAQFN